MKKTLTLLLLLCALVAGHAQHTITGTVTDAKTGETLIGATIYDTLSHKGTVTNQHGRYSLTLKSDTAVIRISFVGCETQFHSIALNANHRIDAKLISSHTLKEVRVVGERVEHIESSIPSRIEIPVEQVKAMPMLFGETDVIKAIQLLPGVQNGSEGTAGMYVRGGGPDENLFLLDGIPMYNVNHLGGFFSAFNSDAVKNIQLYKGSFPARFGSRLSSVLDITTNNGNDKEYHGGVSIGLISAKAYVEGPIVKGINKQQTTNNEIYMKTVFKNCSRYQAQKLAFGILHELQTKPSCNNFEITIETNGGPETVEIKKD